MLIAVELKLEAAYVLHFVYL